MVKYGSSGELWFFALSLMVQVMTKVKVFVYERRQFCAGGNDYSSLDIQQGELKISVSYTLALPHLWSISV